MKKELGHLTLAGHIEGWWRAIIRHDTKLFFIYVQQLHHV